MSTEKRDGWQPQPRPDPDTDDMLFHRQLIVEIVFGLWYRKKEILSKMGMPPQPISLLEIWKEYQSRRQTLASIKKWQFPWHTKRWLDRRVNECACKDFYPNKIPKIVAATAGMYQPNPILFQQREGVVKKLEVNHIVSQSSL